MSINVPPWTRPYDVIYTGRFLSLREIQSHVFFYSNCMVLYWHFRSLVVNCLWILIPSISQVLYFLWLWISCNLWLRQFCGVFHLMVISYSVLYRHCWVIFGHFNLVFHLETLFFSYYFSSLLSLWPVLPSWLLLNILGACILYLLFRCVFFRFSTHYAAAYSMYGLLDCCAAYINLSWVRMCTPCWIDCIWVLSFRSTSSASRHAKVVSKFYGYNVFKIVPPCGFNTHILSHSYLDAWRSFKAWIWPLLLPDGGTAWFLCPKYIVMKQCSFC